MYLSQKQHEVFHALCTAARRLVQWQLKEREGEAPGEAEVGHRAQRWETGWTGRPALEQHPLLHLQPSTPSNYKDSEKKKQRD